MPTLLVGMEMTAATIENSMEMAKKKKRTTTWSSNPNSGYLKKMKPLSQREICTPMFTAVLFTIAPGVETI